jgi:hypothetical protein
MNSLSLDLVREYVNDHIVTFHNAKLRSLDSLQLDRLLTKNPYLFKAKNIGTANELISGLLEAFLSSSEEKLFGDFLEGLAIYIAGITCGGHKSTAQGMDLEFIDKGIYNIVSIKSGPNWGNSSQHHKLQQDFNNAMARVKQLNRGANVEPVLGICYGKTKTSYVKNYKKVVGQSFWHLISDNQQLYVDIIEPIGYRAKEHNEMFDSEKNKVINRFTKQFLDRFCDDAGSIDWVSLVEFNSGNYDLK